MYLTKPAVINVLAELAGRVREFSISFDYMSEEVVARTTGDQPTSSFVERFADRKSTRLNSSHITISYAVFCLKKKKNRKKKKKKTETLRNIAPTYTFSYGIL